MRYVRWLVRCQPWLVLRGSLVGLSVWPYLVARAIDDRLRSEVSPALLLGWRTWASCSTARMTFVREDVTARSAGRSAAWLKYRIHVAGADK